MSARRKACPDNANAWVEISSEDDFVFDLESDNFESARWLLEQARWLVEQARWLAEQLVRLELDLGLGLGPKAPSSGAEKRFQSAFGLEVDTSSVAPHLDLLMGASGFVVFGVGSCILVLVETWFGVLRESLVDGATFYTHVHTVAIECDNQTELNVALTNQELSLDKRMP
ncbi:hypothetical protein BJ741DRAFT_648026 [Chytriomyces cf. hyalinus JEL632]|nr:hypothetical protein BJ741DRAFT_648026 [Chytriomyces cf. hyalinus JEL632]